MKKILAIRATGQVGCRFVSRIQKGYDVRIPVREAVKAPAPLVPC